MKKSIIEELKSHVRDLIADGVINEHNIEEAHFHAFNEDYYIIGYYNAEQWLRKHDVTAFEAIGYVAEQMKGNFGEITLDFEDLNAEYIVNQLVYFAGYEIDIDSIFEEEQNANEYFEAVEA